MKIAHGLLALSVCTSVFLLLSIFDSLAQNAQASELSFSPKIQQIDIDFGSQDYKSVRLREMAQMWKGTVLEKHTVPLLAMLLIENGALSESVRGDHGYAIGLDQTHICIRGFKGKKYCGKGAEKKLAKDLKGTEWENYLTDWRTQFRYFSLTVGGMAEEGYTSNQIIRSWNSLEKGRLAKVDRHKAIVLAAI